ncbi:Conserved_hypothetical protein [Hexamita inflata]|uniref:Uncharacterized protein n=1 Tax=Hexamita inflata TaxID=28002 RepID=A0AA86UB52_9EUKA|nr:Conserved hypothetical protein [Hexamita inflata]
MNSRTTSILHMYAPQRHHVTSVNQASHPVCVEISDYCCKIDRVVPTLIPMSQVRLPVISLIPKSTERFVFDELISDPELFTNLHAPQAQQEVQLLSPKESLDNLACQIVAGAHHGSCKLLLSYGAVGSGHGALSFGISTTPNTIPNAGLLWSVLDAVGSGEWPRVACIQIERDKIRDLFQGDNGVLLKTNLRTKNGLMSAECLEQIGCQFLPVTHQTKVKLVSALHQKRRALARWHAISQVIDRSEQTNNPKLKSIYGQVGSNNYQIGLDCCQTTAVLIQLGPERDYSQILLVDIPSYANESAISEYTPSLELFDVQKQSASIKHLLKTQLKDHLISRVVAGCVPSLFAENSIGKDVFIFTSVQVSDVDRQQTHSVLRLAGSFDKVISDRYFNAYKAEIKGQEINSQLDLNESGKQMKDKSRSEYDDKIFKSQDLKSSKNISVSGLQPSMQGKKVYKIQASDLFREELKELGESDADLAMSSSVQKSPAKSQKNETQNNQSILRPSQLTVESQVNDVANYAYQKKQTERDDEVRQLLMSMKQFLNAM